MILVIASIVVFIFASVIVDWRVGIPLLGAAILNYAVFDVFTKLSIYTADVVLYYAAIDVVVAMILVLLGGRGFITQTVLLAIATLTHVLLFRDVLVGSNVVYEDYEAIIYGITCAQLIFIWRGGYENGHINNFAFNYRPSLSRLFNHENTGFGEKHKC